MYPRLKLFYRKHHNAISVCVICKIKVNFLLSFLPSFLPSNVSHDLATKQITVYCKAKASYAGNVYIYDVVSVDGVSSNDIKLYIIISIDII